MPLCTCTVLSVVHMCLRICNFVWNGNSPTSTLWRHNMETPTLSILHLTTLYLRVKTHDNGLNCTHIQSHNIHCAMTNYTHAHVMFEMFRLLKNNNYFVIRWSSFVATHMVTFYVAIQMVCECCIHDWIKICCHDHQCSQVTEYVVTRLHFLNQKLMVYVYRSRRTREENVGRTENWLIAILIVRI